MWPVLQPAGGIALGVVDKTDDLSVLLIGLVAAVILAASLLVFTAMHHQP